MKKKTGGTWNPKAPFMNFLAYQHQFSELLRPADSVLIAMNMIDTPKALESVYFHLGLNRSVFLDSGIYSLNANYAKEKGIELPDAFAIGPDEMPGFTGLFNLYVKRVRELGEKVWGYVELDQGGLAGKRATRMELESLGLAPIPVYHPLSDGWDYFDELCETYDRICIGNLAGHSPPTRLRLVATIAERRRKYPDVWVHLLGYNPDFRLIAFPPNSVDSSTWLHLVRWTKTWEPMADGHGVGAVGLGVGWMRVSPGKIGDRRNGKAAGNTSEWTDMALLGSMESYCLQRNMQSHLQASRRVSDEPS